MPALFSAIEYTEMFTDQSCDCEADARTMQLIIINECPIPLRPSRKGLPGLRGVSEAGLEWLSAFSLAF